MAIGHLSATFGSSLDQTRRGIGSSRPSPDGLVHLGVMDTHISTHAAIEPVLSLTELAAHLSVSAQTLYDLRSKGRGPRGFRVGRELRFRRSEVDAWLARMEASDAQRHDPGGAR
jgi:excisionase family DNA binding protein